MYGFFAFFSTLTLYNFHRIFKLKSGLISTKNEWIRKRLKYIKGLTISSFLIAVSLLIFLLKNPLKTLPVLIFVALISIFYIIPIRSRPLREQTLMKNIYVATVWTSILFVFPTINEGETQLDWATFSAFFLLFITVCIPFDIRDQKIDEPTIKTIPFYLGITASNLLIHLLLLSFCGLLILNDPLLYQNSFFWIILILNTINFININENTSNWRFALIDSLFGLFGLIYFW
jgi:hypothetical protein